MDRPVAKCSSLLDATWVRVSAGFLLAGALVVLQLARQAGIPATDTIWAEDGRVFLTDALEADSNFVLFRPLAGYMHLVPRVLAEIASLLPLEVAAIVFSLGPALIVASLALYSITAFREVLPSLPSRIVLAVLVALLPASATESANNAANLHFYLNFGALAALIHRPRSWPGVLAGSLLAFAAATSDPRAALLVPLGVWVLLKGTRPQRVIAAALGAGLILQAAVVIASFGFGIDPTTALSKPQFGDSSLAHVPLLYGVRVIAHLMLGDRGIVPAWDALGGWLAVGGWVLLAPVVIGVLTHRRIRRMGLVMIAYSFVFFAFQALAWGTFALWPYGGGSTGNTRYVLAPQLLLVVGVALLLNHLVRQHDDRWRFVLAGVFVALLTVSALHLRVEIVRSAGPRWSTELARARANCHTTGGEVSIQTSPSWSPDWSVRVPCSRLL